MTFEERLAELGIDPVIISLSDDRCDALYEKFYKASEAIAQELGIGFSALTMITMLLRGIAERDDIIDRMETRIVNLTGERDWLLQLYHNSCSDACRVCLYRHPNLCEGEITFTLEDREYVTCQFEYAGVPEDWRVDDD